MKIKDGWVLLGCRWGLLLLACVCLVGQSAYAQTKYYAVQVAALRSEECATELVKGFRARGLDAYVVKVEIPKAGVFYRLRVGKFQNMDVARAFAEKLLDSGLIDAVGIAVTDFEAPQNESLKISIRYQSNLPQSVLKDPIALACPISPGGNGGNGGNSTNPIKVNGSKRPEDFVAALGKSEKASSDNGGIAYSLPRQQSAPSSSVDSSSSEDVVLLMRAIDKSRWRLNNDVAQLVAGPALNRQAIGTASNRQAIDAASNSLNSVLGSSLTPVNLAKATAVRDDASAGAVLAERAPSSPSSYAVPVPARRISLPASPSPAASLPAEGPATITSVSSRSIAEARGPVVPGVRRESLTGGVRESDSLGAIRLQGTIEMRNGLLQMKVKNLDLERPFSGVARVTLSDDRNTNDITPLTVVLQPNEEVLLPVGETSMAYGDVMLMVYDERQAVQLIRSAPFGQRPAQALAISQPVNQPEQPYDPNADPNGWTLTVPQNGQNGNAAASPTTFTPPPANNSSQYGLPNVTGVYDTTGAGNTQPQVPPQPTAPPARPSNSAPAAGVVPGQPVYIDKNFENEPDPNSASRPISINPRQIGAADGGVAMELNIAATKAPGYVTVKVESEGYQDQKSWAMSSLNERVPFLIPASAAKGPYSVKLMDQSGRVLATSSGNFLQLTPATRR